ncbi:AraC family transcriptional regulator [Aquimarina brevivitae]|uniref:AraC family transcriptional regulator n=1 Tax=Aquimarina brevivitae TaxID=323412 RepID=A0A4Q7P0D7_9FLAO|nr:AraC family transcriptional regulator [Aquimarina brevivitae]RZS93114.1 AraC family transcriptional regulator [Aquimarina brevivitae]
MNRYTLQEVLVVNQYSFDQWDTSLTDQNYFQIIFVNSGKGYRNSNGIRLPYQANNIFLSSSKHKNKFEVEEHSKFTYFRFTELVLSGGVNLPERKSWLKRIEQLLHQPSIVPGDVISFEDDREIVWDLHNLVIEEFKSEKVYYQEIIANAISTILSIMVRNISSKHTTIKKEVPYTNNKIDQILSHIRQHVYDNNKTKISFLAEKFTMSQSSISTYFKRKTGDSIHQYVTKYKMKLVEQRLQHTDLTIAEIAYQLGFTDESHLTKTFKKHFTVSPKQYRNSYSET